MVRSTSRTLHPPTQQPSEHVGHKNTWAPQRVFKRRQPAGNRTLLLRSVSPFAELPGSTKINHKNVVLPIPVFARRARNDWSPSHHFTDYSTFLRLFSSKIFTLFVLQWGTEAEDNLSGDKIHDCCSITSYQLVRTYQSAPQPTRVLCDKHYLVTYIRLSEIDPPRGAAAQRGPWPPHF